MQLYVVVQIWKPLGKAKAQCMLHITLFHKVHIDLHIYHQFQAKLARLPLAVQF